MKFPVAVRRALFVLAILAALALAASFAALSAARVEMTAGGAHTRLLVPVVVGAAGINIYTGTGEDVSLPGFLAGPVVTRHADGRWDARWFCGDQVGHASGRAPEVQVACGGARSVFSIQPAPAPVDVGPMPGRLLVLSDLEGNRAFLEAALRKLGVVDATGAWAYGDGELVVLGDVVDRGRDVFAVLWRLHDLSLQAAAAGGAVQLVLGNHEQYLLRGNTSRAHPEYRYALRQLGGPTAAFAPDTLLGAWLRAQPVMLQRGRVLFTHAGISPQVVAAGLSLPQLNAAMRGYWDLASGPVAHAPALDAVIGRPGLTQYRGYFHGMEGFYDKATQVEVERALAHFGADQVVVAHTVVEGVTALYAGRVRAVDVNHDEARPEVLRYVGGIPEVVDIGISRGLGGAPDTRTRGFSLFEAKDRALLGGIRAGFARIAEIPHPY
jgi:hypothetical protein